MDWLTNFWKNHGDRIVFMGLSLSLAGLLHRLELKAEANVIFIGLAMACFNKARGPK